MTKEEFVNILRSLQLNKKEFAILTNLPYSTVNNWGTKRGDRILEIPGWVEPFLLYYHKAKKLDYIMEDVCKKFYDKA